MKITALLTTIVLGTTSIAAAKPAARTTGTETVTLTAGTWFALTEPMSLSRGRDEIKLSSTTAFTTVRVQATAGSSSVRSISVFYAEGGGKVFDLAATLDAGHPMVEVALDGAHRIEKIVVVGTSTRGGAVQLFGM